MDPRAEPGCLNHLSVNPSLSYVEFSGPNDYVNCHSCQGTGIVPKEAQEGLIALIPHDDDRLKPKRRAFYIGIGILAGATACGNGRNKISNF